MIDGEMQDYALTLDKILDHAAKWNPNGQVVTARDCGGIDRIGYADLRRRARKVTTVLRAFGVQTGQKVATLAWNTQAHVEAWYGIIGMGAVCHTLNPRLTEVQLAAMVSQSQARVLIVSADLVPLARDIVALSSSLGLVLVIDGDGVGDGDGDGAIEAFSIVSLEPLIEQAAEDSSWGEFPETTPCGLCFTSGTTGAPKGVTYTHRSSFLHTLRQLQTDAMAISTSDSLLMVVPMFHANAWGLPFAAPAVGARLVLPGRGLDGASIARLIRAEEVSVAVGIATVWLGLIDHLNVTGEETPTLQRIIVGGAPLSPVLMDRIEQRLGVTVQVSWGMTELSPLGTCATPGDPARSAQVSGRPALGVDLLLMDVDGRPLPEQRGVEGHLRVRGCAVIERYFGEAQSATDEDGWFATGDLARIDLDGNLAITGRAKDLIKSGGEWINPAEIEAVINEHPSVSLAAVIARPDLKWGERPVLIVQTRDAIRISDDELLASLRGRVAPWWIPDKVVNVDEMPLASTGKIDKIRLRVEYGGC